MEKRECIIEVAKMLENGTEASPDEPERWKKRSIYNIPVHAVSLNKEAYLPWVAAIGQYHHADERLQRMEEHKKRALRHFLRRAGKPFISYAEALAEVVDDLKDAYGHLDGAWKNDDKRFLQLMITDGCFILETMHADAKCYENEYSPNDLIFSEHGRRNVIPCIKRDMLLLENQVPMLVIEKLHAINKNASIENGEKHEVIERILKFYGREENMRLGKCRHILDVYRMSMIKGTKIGQSSPSVKRPLRHDEGSVHSISATELKQAGIKFKKTDEESLKDAKFEGGTLRLPRIPLDDTSESAFLNMVAFKRLHIGAGNEISSYIYLMNRLVSNERDVRLLTSQGIIINDMSSDKYVAKLFYTLSKEVLLDSDTLFDEIYVEIDRRLGNVFGKYLFKSRYTLFHTYFTSPWAMASVIAAALALIFSMLQLVYAILGYIHRV